MRKMNFFTAVALVAVVGMSSCKDEVVVSSAITIAAKDSATITGYVTADLNLQSAGEEAVPAGTSFVVSIPYSALNASALTGKWQKTVTVATDGKYTVKVPTNSSGVSVTITPVSFDADQTQTYVPGAVTSVVKSTFSKAPFTLVGLTSVQAVVRNFTYTPTPIENPVGISKVLISGKAQAEINAQIPGLENIPAQTFIVFTANGWVDSTQVKSDGTYSIQVPKGLGVTWSVNKSFQATVWKKSSSTTITEYSYVQENQLYNISGAIAAKNIATTDVNINASTGAVPTVASTATSMTLTGLAKTNGGVLLDANYDIYFRNALFTSTSYSWGTKATVSVNGSFTVVVPNTGMVYYEIVRAGVVQYSGSFNPTSLTANGITINGNSAL